MREPKAKVRNAADPKQVGKAAESDADKADRERADLGVVLQTIEGRRFYWKLLAMCKTYESVFAGGNGSLMSYQCGKQDIGHALMIEITTQYPDLYLKMQRESMLADLNDSEPEPTTDV